MGFESGNLSLRVYATDRAFSEELLAGFAREVAPPVETLHREPLTGWVGPRHLLDRDLSPENCMAGGTLRITLMKAERKVPPSLLRAHCRLAEQEELNARDVPYLNRATRREIKEQVLERLLPGMPPSLTGIPALFDLSHGLAYAQALSPRQQDAFVLALRQATGVAIVPLTPEVAALKLKAVNHRDLEPARFTPQPAGGVVSPGLGLEFLTWLWFDTETGAQVSPGGTGPKDPVWCVEGPLTFVEEGDGAHEAVLRKGMPLLSAEAKTALLSGKKLRRANLLLARGEEQWRVALDAADFAFRGIKLPKPELADPAGVLEERIRFLQLFQELFYRLYERFLDLRRDRSAWEGTVARMREWVAARKTRA